MTRAAVGSALALGLLVLAGCGGGDAVKATAPTATSGGAPAVGWTVVADARRGLRVAFPSSWRRAKRSLTPFLSDPREILSVGTGALVAAPGRCAHMPVGALSRLRAGDVLLSLQERQNPGRGYPLRPSHFRLGRANLSEAAACLSDPSRLDTWWMPFRDGHRAFYALVALGRPVADERRRLAERVLDSLRFAPRRVREAG